MSWQVWVVPSAATVAGLGASVWLIYLDYRRRSPSPEAPRAVGWWSRPSVGPALVVGGLLAGWLTGGKSGWSAVGCYVPALIGLALMAAHATRSMPRSSERDPGEDRRQV